MYVIFKKQLEEDEQFDVIEVNVDFYLPIIKLADARDFYIAEDFTHASESAVQFWNDIIEKFPEKLADMIGESVLKNWEKGEEDGPGDEKVNTSLQMWVENTVAKHPDIAFGHLAGCEHSVVLSADLAEQIGFSGDTESTVCYPVPEITEIGTIPPPEASKH